MLRLLDLFAGMGGWSVGFHREGFNCVGLDIIDVGYPYYFIQRDIRDYHYNGEVKPDVVIASPPCTEFSPMTKLSAFKGQRKPPDPYGPEGIGLVKEALRVIREARPRYWALENVYGSVPYISELSHPFITSRALGRPKVDAKPFMLWGQFPEVLWPDMEKDKSKNKLFHQEALDVAKKNRGILPQDFPFDPLRSWKRARIPVWIGQTIAKAIKADMQGHPVIEGVVN